MEPVLDVPKVQSIIESYTGRVDQPAFKRLALKLTRYVRWAVGAFVNGDFD
jgi:hypothetical protein